MNGNTDAGEDELPGRIERSPDPKRIRDRRASLSGWRRTIYDHVVVPAEIPQEFNEPLAELIDRLRTADPLTAATILEEAQAISAGTMGRIDSAERRATTLQGTVAIAASLAVTGAGLLLDPSKVPDRDWQFALLALLGCFLACLIGCAWRALSVTGRMFEFEQPGPERIHLRAQAVGPDAQAFRAAELLRAAGVASEVGAVKIGLLRAAAGWLRLALIVLAAFMAALAVLVATTDPADTTRTRPAQIVGPRAHPEGRVAPPRSDGSRRDCWRHAHAAAPLGIATGRRPSVPTTVPTLREPLCLLAKTP